MSQDEQSTRLERLRKHLDLNQTEMGELIGLSRAVVSMVEKGHRPLTKASKLNFDRLWKEHMEGKTPTGSEFTQRHELPTESEVLREPMGQGRSLLKAAREAKGLTQKQLADKVGYSLGVYQGIEDGGSNMSEKMAARVALELGIQMEDLLRGADEPPTDGLHYGTVGKTPPIVLPPGSKARYVPLLSMAQCGEMGAYSDSAYDHTGFLVIDPKDSKAFSVKLAGESMMPALAPGDIAVIYPSYSPKNGGLVIARLNEDHGSDVMVKIYQSSPNQVTLTSYNPLYPPITYPRDAFSWIYPVASVSKVFLE